MCDLLAANNHAGKYATPAVSGRWGNATALVTTEEGTSPFQSRDLDLLVGVHSGIGILFHFADRARLSSTTPRGPLPV